MTYWVFLALALAGLKCDDTCSGDEASWWGYPGQFVLAALSSVLGLAALTVGFTSHKRPYRILLAYSIAGALVWAVLVFGGAF